MMTRTEVALVEMLDAIKTAKSNGLTDEVLTKAQRQHRQAQWRLDFIAAENSMGFHAPQETARILAEAIDLARQAEVQVLSAGK